MDVKFGTVVGFGNPLLDLTYTAEDNLLLEKYGLNANEAILAEDKHMPLFEELSNLEDVKFSAGGACQNSLRVFSWMTGAKNAAVFYGAVGNDKFAEILAKRARAGGFETRYQIVDDKPTGTCAVIVNGANRSVVANLGAASGFMDEDMDEIENQCVLKRALIYYITGFFLAVCPATVQRVAKFSNENKRTLVFNFSAAYVMEMHKEQVDSIIPFIDIIIGNKEEVIAFADAHDWNTNDCIVIGCKLQELPKADLKPRIVIITDALCPILEFGAEGKVKEHPVPKFDKDKIVDTNGCGDALVGAFLAQLCRRMPIDYCLRSGIWASQQILQVVGVNLDKIPKFEESCI